MTDIGIPGASVTRGNEETSSSSSEFDGPLEVHENSQKNVTFGVKEHPLGRSSPIRFSTVRGASSDIGPSRPSSKLTNARERKATGLFGNLAALFKTSMVGKPITSGQWNTRTDRHLRNASTDLDDSDDDHRIRSGRLRKGKMRVTNERPGSILVSDGVLPPSTPPLPSADASTRNQGGPPSRHSTLRSTFSQESKVRRVRANTLTTITPAIADLPEKNQRQIDYQRRTSLEDHRESMGSSGSIHRAKASPTSHLSKRTDNKGASIMSILEPSVYNKLDNPSSKLELARAPGNRPGYPSILIHHPPPLAVSSSSPAGKQRSLPAGSGTSSPASDTTEKKPLRSAMRHPNREGSVSPIPFSSSNTTNGRGPHSSTMRSPSPELITASTPRQTPRPDIPSTILESPRQSLALDGTDTHIQPPLQADVSQRPTSPASSITSETSSYETGIENFNEDDVPTPSGPSPPTSFAEKPLPATVLDAHAHEATLDKHEFSSATSGETPPVRRKSVRLSSLPPQVLNRTPSQEKYEKEYMFPVAPKPTWPIPSSAPLNGWKTRISVTHPNDIWQDSSSEEEGYKAARRALNFMDKN